MAKGPADASPFARAMLTASYEMVYGLLSALGVTTYEPVKVAAFPPVSTMVHLTLSV
jgi:hypothetical protein